MQLLGIVRVHGIAVPARTRAALGAVAGLVAMVAAWSAPPESASASASVPGDARASAATTLTILHYNIAGGTARRKNRGRLQVVGRVFREIAGRGVDVVTLNEVCERQHLHLIDDLRDAKIEMEGHFQPTHKLSDCDRYGAGQQGNAIYVRGGINKVTDYYFWRPNDLQRHRPARPLVFERGASCVTTPAVAGLRACVTHLDTRDDVAGRQITELARTFGDDANKRPYVIGGDFNVAPDRASAALSRLYAPALGGNGSFFEVDMAHGRGAGATATHGEGKLDYIFASANRFGADMTAEVLEPAPCYGEPCSDHKMLIGHLTLNPITSPPRRATGCAPIKNQLTRTTDTSRIRAIHTSCKRARRVASSALKRCYRGTSEAPCNATRRYRARGFECRQTKTSSFELPVRCRRARARVRFEILLD